jgi:hypothetical protein
MVDLGSIDTEFSYPTMKYQTNKQHLLSVLFCSLITVAFGFGSWIDRPQDEILTKKPPQQGSGRAPNPSNFLI